MNDQNMMAEWNNAYKPALMTTVNVRVCAEKGK